MDYIAQQVAEQMKASRDTAIRIKIRAIAEAHNTSAMLIDNNKLCIRYKGYATFMMADIEDKLAGIDLKMTLHPSSKTLVVEWQ